MKVDSRWYWMLILVFGGLVIYAAFPLLIHGIALFLTVTTGLLLAIPLELWWIIGILVLTLMAIKVMLRLGRHLLGASKTPISYSRPQGRLTDLHHTLLSASRGDYSKENVRQLLHSLAIDLIALERDISQDEARRSFIDRTWTRNEALKSYLYKEREFRPRRLGWLRRSEKETPEFLKETKEALDELEHYRRFGDQEEIDVRDSDG